MRLRTLSLVLLAALLALGPGCSAYYGVGKATGLMSPKSFSSRGQIPPDFRLSASRTDSTDPPTDYTVVFERSGKATYDVTVRLPRRRHVQGTFELTEDQIVGLWRTVAEVKFDELDERYPSSGDGTEMKRGVQLFYVFADGVDRRVEVRFSSTPEIEKIRQAIIAVIPKDVMTAAGASGEPKNAPKEYLADSATHLFHMPDCPQLKDVPAQRRQPFGSPWDALNYGFQPCPECQPLKTK